MYIPQLLDSFNLTFEIQQVKLLHKTLPLVLLFKYEQLYQVSTNSYNHDELQKLFGNYHAVLLLNLISLMNETSAEGEALRKNYTLWQFSQNVPMKRSNGLVAHKKERRERTKNHRTFSSAFETEEQDNSEAPNQKQFIVRSTM